MDNQVFVSIIIPVFNAAPYLDKCLSSVCQSKIKNIEIICIDDGTTDRSLEILSKYEKNDARIRIIRQKNSGVSAARNKGILNAKGEYIAFLDADDFVDKNTYKISYTQAKKYNADIVVFGGTTFPPVNWADNVLNTRSVIYTNEPIYALMKENGSKPFPVNKIYKRNLFVENNLSFDPNLMIGEDQALMFDLFPLAKKIVYIDNKFYHYRQHDNSAMFQINLNFEDKISSHIKIVQHIFTSWTQKGYSKEHGKELAEWILSFLAEDLKKTKQNFRVHIYEHLLEIIDQITDYSNLSNEAKKEYDFMKIQTRDSGIPDISIIMPVYNAEQFLEDTLKQIINQTFLNYELIIIDDGSTDNSLEIINQFSEYDRRIRIFQQQHKYAGVARNLGIKESKGKYLLFLDADDFFDPKLLENSFFHAKTTEADICVFPADRYDQQTKQISPMLYTCDKNLCPDNSTTFSRKNNAKNIYCFTTPAPWNKLFRKEFVIQNHLTFQNTRSANDMAFVMTALAIAEKISVIDEVLISYRVNNPKSLQGSQDLEPLAFYEALLELKQRLKDKNVLSEIEPAFINFALDICIYNLKTMKTPKGFEYVYMFLKNDGFKNLDLLRWQEDYFYAYKTNRIYEQREDILNLSIIEYVKKYHLFGCGEIKQIECAANKSETELLNNSISYRTRRVIIWFPRRIRDVFFSVKKNGISQTISKIIEKIKGTFG